LSFLVVACSVFVERPLMPIAFVLHERKFESVHEMFFKLVKAKYLAISKSCIVTDGEAGILKAISSVYCYQMLDCLVVGTTFCPMWNVGFTNTKPMQLKLSYIRTTSVNYLNVTQWLC